MDRMFRSSDALAGNKTSNPPPPSAHPEELICRCESDLTKFPLINLWLNYFSSDAFVAASCMRIRPRRRGVARVCPSVISYFRGQERFPFFLEVPPTIHVGGKYHWPDPPEHKEGGTGAPHQRDRHRAPPQRRTVPAGEYMRN